MSKTVEGAVRNQLSPSATRDEKCFNAKMKGPKEKRKSELKWLQNESDCDPISGIEPSNPTPGSYYWKSPIYTRASRG